MKIAFVKPPATYANWYRRPLLGIASLAAYLERHGYDCRIFDSVFSGWSEAELMAQLDSYGPDLAAFTAMTHEIDAAGRIALRLRQGGTCATVVGGCHFSALPQRTLIEFPGFDYGIAGEGEEPLLALTRSLESGGKPDRSIPGLASRPEKGTVAFNHPAPPLSGEALDRLPFPAFHLYFGDDSGALAGTGDEYPILSSRGCPYRCAFCMQALGRTVRLRSAERILEEMKAAVDAYGAHTFNFIDEIFLTDTPRTHDLLERMISSGLSRSIRWSGLTRANLVSGKLVEKAAR
ncbi:MAG TPA: radical SAM protein, partial [bacterium]|nr:radical SAM protein [bacterium]